MIRSLTAVVVMAAAFIQAPERPPARLDASAPITFFVESGRNVRGFRDGDPELARDAFDAWSRESGGVLTFSRRDTPSGATIRIRWISAGDGLYGETERLAVNGKPGAIVNVMPEVSMQGEPLASLARSDQLLRDSVVYLTCVHEIGHALGLEHSRDDADIMYYFAYGGNVVQYFERYRRLLQSRDDIRIHSGISAADRQNIRRIYMGVR